MLRGPDQERPAGQMADEQPSFASVLSHWIRRERLRPRDIERATTPKNVPDARPRITRAHLWLMTHGRVSRPTPETLRDLALAVATDPNDGTVDRLKRDEALRAFSRATGHLDLTSDVESGDLVFAIQAVVCNQQVAEFWTEMVTSHPDISPTTQHLIRALIDMQNRPGGSDIVSLLLLLNGPDQPSAAELLRRLTMGTGDT